MQQFPMIPLLGVFWGPDLTRSDPPPPKKKTVRLNENISSGHAFVDKKTIGTYREVAIPNLLGSEASDELIGSDQSSLHHFRFGLDSLTIGDCRLVVSVQHFQLVFQAVNVAVDLFQVAHRLVIDFLQFGHLLRHRRQ